MEEQQDTKTPKFQEKKVTNTYLSTIHLAQRENIFLDARNPSSQSFKWLKIKQNVIIYKLRKKMSNSSYQLDQPSSTSHKRPYHRIGENEKNKLIYEVFQNKLSISKASRKVGINNSTAKVVIRKYKVQLKKSKSSQKNESFAENRSVSIQEHLNAIPSNQSQTPFLFFLTAPPTSGWLYNYPFNIASPIFPFFHNLE